MRRKPPTVVPVLVPCPHCKLPVQPGKNQNGLAFHDCQFVLDGAGRVAEATVEVIRALTLRRLRDLVSQPSVTPKELVAVLGALPAIETESPSTSADPTADVVAWLGAKTARPRPRPV